MSTSPESLHLLAHQAQLRARTEDDWWDNPLDTALAAVNATRHPPAFRRDGQAAVQRLRRWLHDGHPRRVSADVAALALAAAASADLGLRDSELKGAAVAVATDLSGRSRTSAPPLHIALTVWGFDSVVTDRAAEPWPALREHLSTGSPVRGADAPVAALAAALSAITFDAPGLVRRLLSDVPNSPSLEDGAVLLWVLTIAIEHCSAHLGDQDSGLRALNDRRSELALRLAQELDAEAFKAPELADFSPSEELDLRSPTFLSPMEALLLDISLASRERDMPWLRFEEAAEVFGARERRVARALAVRTAALLATVGALAGALLAVVLDHTATTTVAILVGATVTSAMACASALVWQRHRRDPFSRALTMFFLALTISVLLDLVNQSLHKPLLPDIAGAVVGILAAAVLGVAAAMSPGKSSPK